ncbi:RHS repeat-associated core domain-containing protein [Amycolatopsis sp. NPDC059090]|uniref:RHS repeat-associated core domain-containing protein n=1 Tax=unclassified Amycolatopsis TaxID=2618356 RepID=UPI00366C48CA
MHSEPRAYGRVVHEQIGPVRSSYSWLGQHQRPYEHAGALSVVQMGELPYSPLFARFMCVDPVDGGSANDYDYVNADPINEMDLTGTCSWNPRSWGGCAKKALKATSRGLVAAGKWAWRNKWTIASGVGAGGVLWGTQTARDIYRKQFSRKKAIGNGLLTLGGGAADRLFAGAWRARNVV